MRIVLISSHTHPFALGLRILSACLKSAGHAVELIFMCSRRDTAAPDYTPAALADLATRARAADLVGVSLMTNNYHRACALTAHLRGAGVTAPIVWGGTHPTVAPEESLAEADAVCIGEGEGPLAALVTALESRGDPTAAPGWWFRGGGRFGGQTRRNAPAPLEHDLDRLPFADYELGTQWVAARTGLMPAEPDNLRGALETFRVITARGCPYRCAFCNNAALQQVYESVPQSAAAAARSEAAAGSAAAEGRRGAPLRWVRTRSIDNVLAELRQVRARFPGVRAVNFVDDLFLVRSPEEIERFAATYNAEIGLPLQLDAFPNTVTERKVRALARLPIELVSMGIESASDDTLRNIYHRPTRPQRIAEAIGLLSRHRVRAEYHYIVSNPYEPDANVVETMRFVATHHRGPAIVRVFPLLFFPGTPLYERARADGRIGPRDAGAYDHMGTGALELARHDYLAVWLRVVLGLKNAGLPAAAVHRLIDFVTAPRIRWLLDRRAFAPTAFVSYQVTRKLYRNVIHQLFIKPFQYLRRPRVAARPPVAMTPQNA